MMWWPTVSLLGFLVLTALVIAMGTRSTARYEQEQRAEPAPAAPHGGADSPQAVVA